MTLTLHDQRLIDSRPTRDKTCYISGPMRGYDLYNFPAFHAAQNWLEKRGWHVYSPAAMDRDLDGFDGQGDWQGTLSESLRRDFSVICRSGAMFLLKGWENSTGANEELKVANTLALNVYEFEYDGEEIIGFEPLVINDTPRWVQVDQGEPFAAMPGQIISLPHQDSEVRIVDPATGGAKGQKLARFDLIPQDALFEVAKVYGVGSKKYEDRNWERGYAWGLSYGALQRHLSLDMQGEDMDPEGFYHLAAVAWHALALLAFRLRNVGTDDRGPVVG